MQETVRERRRVAVRAVLWGAAALLLAGLLWTLLGACGLRLVSGLPVLDVCPAPVPGPDPRLLAERLRREALEAEIRRLELDLLRRPVCTPPSPPEPPPVQEVQPTPPPPPTAQAEPVPPPPEPAPPPVTEVPPSPPPLPPCPEGRRRPTEVLLVLDASLSMKFDYDLDPETEARILEMERAGPLGWLTGQLLAQRLMSSPGRDRIDVAKDALGAVVRNSPDDVTFGMLSFARCGPPRSHGTFPPSRRRALLAEIAGVDLDNSTALADALEAVPRHVEGGRSEDDPVNIVLVSDGRDSCGGDPCAAARALKRRYPYAYVNVIGIGRGTRELRCVAEATGGSFVEASNADRLPELLKRAAGQDLPEHCR